jgi:hypothetical protein
MSVTVSVPTWVWVPLGVLLWYMAAGITLRLWVHFSKEKLDAVDKFWAWILSPFLAVALPVVLGVWTLLWVVSVGFVPPPWSK